MIQLGQGTGTRVSAATSQGIQIQRIGMGEGVEGGERRVGEVWKKLKIGILFTR